MQNSVTLKRKGDYMSNQKQVINIDVKSPDTDLYFLNRFKLNAVKEWGVEINTLNSHTKKANNDSNSFIFIGGPASELPTGWLNLDREKIQFTVANIVEALENEDELNLELEKYNQLSKNEKSDYLLNADIAFKTFYIMGGGEPCSFTEDLDRDEDGNLIANKNELRKLANEIIKQQKENYFEPYIQQLLDLQKESIDNKKIIGILPANEEFKAENIGYKNLLKEFADRANLKDAYIENRFAQYNFSFNSFLTDNRPQTVSMLVATGLYDGKDAKAIKNKLYNIIAKQHPNADFVVSMGYSELAVFCEQINYYDEKHNIFITKPQFYINMPGYQNVGDPNKVRLKSFKENTINNYKLKMGVCKNPTFIKFPELLDEKGNIIDVFSEHYLSSLKKVDEISDLDRKVTPVYEAPYVPYCHVIELGKQPNTPSYSPLLKSLYPKNAPKSEELKAQIVNMKRLISDLPNLVRETGAKNLEEVAKFLETYDFHAPQNAINVMKYFEQKQKDARQKTVAAKPVKKALNAETEQEDGNELTLEKGKK